MGQSTPLSEEIFSPTDIAWFTNELNNDNINQSRIFK